MKKFKLFKLLALFVVLITSINAWGQTYKPARVDERKAMPVVTMQGAGMQSQQMMSGGAYNGTVYEPFSNATPSEASNPAKAPGGPRRGYNPETGEWTPDSEDIETAGDYGQSEESPIGEPWVMALFALAFAGMIAIRQYKRKTAKSMNMKNSTSKFIATLALLCTIGVGQMWANTATVYVVPAKTWGNNWSSSKKVTVTFNTDDGWWGEDELTPTGIMYDGCEIYSKTYTDLPYDGFRTLWIRRYNGSTEEDKFNAYNDWATCSYWNSHMRTDSWVSLDYSKYDITSGVTVYFDNTDMNMSAVQMYLGKPADTYSYDMTHIEGTPYYYKTFNANWDDFGTLVFRQDDSWTKQTANLYQNISSTTCFTPTSGNNKTSVNTSYIVGPKALSKTNTTTVIRGEGTSGNRYRVAPGTTITVSASGSKIENSHTVQYKFNNGSWSTTNTFEGETLDEGDTYEVTVYVRTTDGVNSSREFNLGTYYYECEVYTVAGTPADVFGSEWAANNTDNDMIYSNVEGKYLWQEEIVYPPSAPQYKVTVNHGWTTSYPNDNQSITGGTKGISYNVTISYDPSNNAVTHSIRAVPRTVTFDKESGTGGTDSQDTYYGESPSNITPPTRTGYTFAGYYDGDNGTGNLVINSSGVWQGSKSGFTDGSTKWILTSDQYLYAKWTPVTFYVRFNGNGNTGGSMSNQTFTYDAAQSFTSNTFTKTGYTFDHWDTQENDEGTDYTNGQSVSNLADEQGEIADLYAQWSPNPYTVTLDIDEDHKGTIASKTTSQNVIYDAETTTVPALPTGATGYALYGYYTDHNGGGTKVIDADGKWIASVGGYTDESKNWVHPDDVTLYAYYKNVEISDMTFDPETEAGEQKVVATPTFDITPEGTVYVFWKLFKNAECTHEAEGVKFKASSATLADLDNDLVTETNPSTNNAGVAFKTPAFTGSYYLQTIVRDANAKPYNTLDSVVYQYIVASDHTVTIKYMCGGVEIAPRAEVVVPAAGYKGIKALSGNDVFGYQFSSWSLGDGLTNECVDASTCGAAGKDSIYISAVYNGTLTANYSKKNMIFFKDNLGWTDPENASAHVYVNFLNGTWWDSGKGTGNNTLGDRKNKVMNRVPGTTNIFYYEYSLVPTKYLSFAQHERDQDAFYDDTSHPAQIVYVTNPTPAGSDMSANYGFDAATPMFVPLDKDTYAGQLWNTSHALYFNRGYWVNYVGEETGYYLDLYKSDGSTLIKSVPFTSEDKLMSMSVTLDLEAATDYYFKLRRGSSITYGNSGYMKSNDSGTAIGWEFKPDVDNKCKIKTTAAGDYTFLLSYSGNDADPVVHALRIGVTYPSSEGDYRIVYKDLATWSQGSAHTASWYHPSRVIIQRANAEDLVSFYVSKADGANASLTLQQVQSINASTGAITWTAGSDISSLLSSITESGVYNFKITQDENKAVSVTYEGAYEGNYYIRTDNAGSSKWSDYIALDHQMTYSEYAQNSGYTHYYMHYCQRGTNVKFCIANDYSPCISDTLIRDITRPFDQNMDENGFLYTTPSVAEYADKYSANIRFMWNQNTNKISRAYLSSAQMDNILVLTNNGTTGSVMDENDVDKSGANIKFKDDQNWIYEAIVKVKPSAGVRLKVFARYSNAGNAATKDQYLIGSYNSGTYDASSSELLLTGTGDILQTIRVVYDFKTNRLVKAWMPTSEIEGPQKIDADLMIVREHQQAAQNILLVDNAKAEHGSLKTGKKIYSVMRFNRWILSNRANPEDKSDTHAGDDYYTYHPLLPVGQWLPTYERSLYYVSFPYDVKISEIFGFGNYGTHYAIQRYDGAGRAKNGYWVDSDPNWKWVPPTGTLNAYEGYVLSLSMSNMDAGNTSVWANKSSEIELYFPSSTTDTIVIQNTNVKIDSLDSKTYKCTIERDKRNIKDSYWRCIGVPSYANYSGTLTDKTGGVINWQKDNISLPFIYEINWQDKSLTPFVGTNFPFKAMHSYLVQYGGEIHWTNVVNVPSSIVAREKSADAEQIFQLELSQNNEYCDRTFVRMTENEDVTNNFDFNQDLSKETNSGRANIWTLTADSVSAAGNSMPISDQTTIVPVGVKIIADGDYTFALPESVEGVGVVLIDNIAGTRTNLALTDYIVNLTAGTYDGRFLMEISPIAQAPTDIETISDERLEISGVRKVMVDGVLYIVKDGKVFDARGNRVQ